MTKSIDFRPAPVALFVYNRPQHTRQTLESLKANTLADQSELFIYADGPKADSSPDDVDKIGAVREVIRKEQWCKTVHIREAEKNEGLADSIIDGVSEIVSRFGNIIVLEDDLVLSKSFLLYMNQALNIYAADEKVMHVSGYMYPIKGKLPKTFFVNLGTCWGWGTWKRAWDHFESDPALLLEKLKKTDSLSRFNLEDSYDWYSHLVANVEGSMKTWAIRWYTSFYLKSGFSLHPNVSLVRNIGNDDSGSNCGTNSLLMNQVVGELFEIERIPVTESLDARRFIKDYFLGDQDAGDRIRKPIDFARKLKTFLQKIKR